MSLKLRLLTKHFDSASLKALADKLSEQRGYKVYRANFHKPNRVNLLYGDCKNKLQQYEWFAANEVPALPFTTSHEVVSEWLQEGAEVFGRKLLRSSEGKGIVVFNPGDEVTPCKVYTKYLKKKKEFRVHVFQNTIVTVMEKRKKKDSENKDTKIRNTANGYVFCRQDVQEPDGIRELALKAAKVTGSDFKGVDIGYNEKFNQLFVIEVNSAPGFVGTTVEDYANAINQAYPI